MEENAVGMDAMFKGLVSRGYSPSVVYDIGAAEGGWTRWASIYWPAARFICFEPLEERQADLKQLEKENARVQCVFSGLGDVDDVRQFGVTDDLYGSSFAYEGRSSRSVKIQRLDSLVEGGKIPLPNFMKLDVQGYEKHVLNGGELATRAAELILMECNFFAFCEAMSTLDVTIAYMSAKGYIPYEFVDFLRRPLDGAMGQCDILFVRRDHPLVSRRRWV